MAEGVLAGRAVLLTGASRGIGAAAARAFAAAGARVALTARSPDSIAALAGEVGGLALPGDVADPDAMPRAVAETCRAFGRLDVLVNNAGVIDPIGPLEDTDPEAWGRLIDINLKGVYHGMRAALPVMKRQRAGTIVTLSSGAAHAPLEGWSAYCASKAACAMLTRAAHLEAAGDGVRVMGLAPGTIATDMQARIRDSGINRIAQMDWSAHGQPDWVGRALVWMATPDADGWAGPRGPPARPRHHGAAGPRAVRRADPAAAQGGQQ